jgi:transcription elongation factor GreA
MTKVSYVTEQGLEKLMKELERLETVERPNISQQIAEARDKGDLSENAEYDAAKEAQGMLEMRISKLKDTIANSRVLDQSKIDTSTVQILNKVKIKNIKNGAVMEYTIVSDSEANLKEGKMSINTPIAKGLLGKKVGDIAEVEVPNGKMEFEIVEISI